MDSMTASRVTPLREPDLDRLRQPPANTEAEQALLGAMLINNAAYHRVAEFLLAEHFGNAVHGRIYAAIGQLIGRDAPADLIMVRKALGDDTALVPLGGTPKYLALLVNSAVTIVNAEHYALAIVEAAERRRLFDIGQAVIEAAWDPDHAACRSIAARARRLGGVCNAARARTDIAADLADIPAPERPWTVQDWIPRRQPTVLTGNGGGGKSQIALQLQVAASAGFHGSASRLNDAARSVSMPRTTRTSCTAGYAAS